MQTRYDADNKTTQYVPDELNRIAQVVNAQGTTQYDYFRDSQLKTVTYPNNIRSRYTYDTAGRVDTIINTQNSAVVSSYDYDYDRNGNRTEQIEINGGAAETTTYDFDDLDRLTGVTYPDQTVTYTYDLAYNRKTEIARSSDNTVTKHWQYQYNDRHQLTDILDQLDNANSITYSYDDNGNQTAKTKASEITAFVFDARDDMRRVQVGGSTVGQFLYDAAGLRIEKAGDRGIERYTYDDLSVLRQFDENNQTLAKFDYGPNRLLSLRHSTEGIQFYLMDALNSVVNLANASGAVQARYQYDAWGNKRNETGSSWNRFGFTGHEHDTESGLIYAKARFYDPETGRFLGQDAWEGDTQLPPSLHKYLYAYQNPTVYIDPDGNKSVFGNATEQLGNFNEWLGEQNEAAGSQLAAAPIGTAQFVTTLGEGITRPLDIAANLAQVAAGVDDQQVRDELAGTKQFIGNAADFLVNGDYAQAAKNAHSAAVSETADALGGNVSATANLAQAALAVATLRSEAKGKPIVATENSTGSGALVLTEMQSLKKIQSEVAKRKSLNERINSRTPAQSKSLISGGERRNIRPDEGGSFFDIQGPAPRGEAIEAAIGKNTPGPFKTIDRLDVNELISIKSVDVTLPSLLKEKRASN